MTGSEFSEQDPLHINHRTFVSADGEMHEATSCLDQPLTATPEAHARLRAEGLDPNEYLEQLRREGIARHNSLLAEASQEAEEGLDFTQAHAFVEARGLPVTDWIVMDGLNAYNGLRRRHSYLPELGEDGGVYVPSVGMVILVRRRELDEEAPGPKLSEYNMVHEQLHAAADVRFAGLSEKGGLMMNHGFVDERHHHNTLEEIAVETPAFQYYVEQRYGQPVGGRALGEYARWLYQTPDESMNAYKYGVSLLARLIEHQPDTLDLLFASRVDAAARTELLKRLDNIVQGSSEEMLSTPPYTNQAGRKLRRLDAQAALYFERQQGLPGAGTLWRLAAAKVAEYRGSQSFTVRLK